MAKNKPNKPEDEKVEPATETPTDEKNQPDQPLEATLTITEAVEVRYRTETRTDTWTDSEGNSHSDTYTVEPF